MKRTPGTQARLDQLKAKGPAALTKAEWTELLDIALDEWNSERAK